MAFEDYDDYERSEVVAAWLRENAAAIISGIAIGLLLIFGINQWRDHQATHRVEAASQYQALSEAVGNDDAKLAQASLAKLQSEYKDTAYAVFSALKQADMRTEEGDLTGAAKALAWAENHAGNKAIKALTQLRLARIQFGQDKFTEALQTLAAMPAGSYTGLGAELRGDILAAQDEPEAARTAYQKALDYYTENQIPLVLVQMKMDNLAVTDTAAITSSEPTEPVKNVPGKAAEQAQKS